MDEKTMLPMAAGAIVDDCVVVPRTKYDLLRDAVSTLKTLRTLYASDHYSSYDLGKMTIDLLFPENLFLKRRKENDDA